MRYVSATRNWFYFCCGGYIYWPCQCHWKAFKSKLSLAKFIWLLFHIRSTRLSVSERFVVVMPIQLKLPDISIWYIKKQLMRLLGSCKLTKMLKNVSKIIKFLFENWKYYFTIHTTYLYMLKQAVTKPHALQYLGRLKLLIVRFFI